MEWFATNFSNHACPLHDFVNIRFVDSYVSLVVQLDCAYIVDNMLDLLAHSQRQDTNAALAQCGGEVTTHYHIAAHHANSFYELGVRCCHGLNNAKALLTIFEIYLRKGCIVTYNIT